MATTAKAAKSATTVTVACKLPHGLVLRLFDMVDGYDPQRDGTNHRVKRAETRPGTVVIRGYLPKYDVALPPAAQGSNFALTYGVDKEFFDEWMRQNKEHDAVINNLIFAHVTVDGATKQAKEMEGDTRSGLEPIDTSKLKGRIQTFDAKSQ